jgi:two-component sensor histidine kinase
VEPFDEAAGGGVMADGPSIPLPARRGRILGLVLHELATNATKYGALSVPEGRVKLSWSMQPAADVDGVRLRWIERGGPPVEAPGHRGFGTKLITTLAGYELDGEAQLKYNRSGLEYELDFSVEG